jgi:hypothetical protein
LEQRKIEDCSLLQRQNTFVHSPGCESHLIEL